MKDRGSRKVVLVLDHGARFAVESGASVPISVKQGNVQKEVGTCKKTLWTWCAESVLEYHRVVSDLFAGSDRLIRVAVADSVGRLLHPSWGSELISSKALNMSLAKVGAPSVSGEDSTPISGILLAVEALSQRTEKQMNGGDNKAGRPLARYPGQKGEDSIKSTDAPPISNDGSIIVFCSLKSSLELTTLQQEVSDQILHRNNSLVNIGDGSYIPIGHVDLYIVNTYAVNAEPAVPSEDRKEISANLSCTVISRPAGDELVSAAHSVCLSVYDLVSTTVSGIPMKEEAHQGQSVNYDVELLHSREAHAALEILKLSGPNGFLSDNSHQKPYLTCKLSWSTPSPKNKWNLFPRTLSAIRVSPAAVNSRPSVCLTSFLLGGRNVMLEVKREKSGPAENMKPNVNQKLISHTLIGHGGRIYIHAIDILPNSVLDLKYPKKEPAAYDSGDDEDLKLDTKNFTSIKKADYEDDEDDYNAQKYGNTPRSTEFLALMKECFLRPRKATDKIPPLGPGESIPCGIPLRHIRRLTRYWPLCKEDTLIFQFPEKFSDLLSLYRKIELSPAQVEDCKKYVYRIASMKDDKGPLFRGAISSRLVPDPKNKEEVYKVAVIELASYMANYANNSESHMEILKILIQVLDLDRIVNIPLTDVLIVEELTEPRALENMAQSAPNTATSSRSSSPVPKKVFKSAGQWSPNESLNVYDFLAKRSELNSSSLGRPDFVGRVDAGNRPAQLYKGIDFSNAAPRGEVPI